MTTYLSKEVFPIIPHGPIQVSIQSDQTDIVGRVEQKTTKTTPQPVEVGLDVQIERASATERKTLNDFIDARQGPVGAFWMRSHRVDLTTNALEPNAETVIELQLAEDDEFLTGLAGGRHCYIKALDSFHEITAPTPNHSTGLTTITVTPAIGAELPAGSEIEFAYLVRIDGPTAAEVGTPRYRSGEVLTSHTIKMREVQRETD